MLVGRLMSHVSLKKDTKSRRWCFTLNNYSEEECDKLSGLKCVYLIYGHEIGMNGTPHLQGYVVFKNQKRFETLHRFLERAHWSIAEKGHQANIIYCSKDDPSPFEKGERPVTKDKRTIDAKDILESDLINGPKKLATKRLLLGMKNEQEMFKEVLRDDLQKPFICYIHGDSGTGKTYSAIKMAGERFGYKNCATLRFDKNGFAHCNNPHADALIIMEFRPSCVDAVTFLELTDGYGIHLNMKHGGCFIRPKALYICSILPPQSIYKEEINHQFMRRITVIVNKDEDPFQEDSATEEI